MVTIKNIHGDTLHTVDADNLRGAYLHGADLYYADLREADLSEANMSKEQLVQFAECFGINVDKD